ncbi:MAG: class I SAM-dependent methyltransferase [Phycisphaerae bacterium]
MPDLQTISTSIRDLYMTYPFPQTTRDERLGYLVFQVAKYKFLGLDEVIRDGRILDVGCGTGRNIMIAKHVGAREYVGLDYSAASIEIAKRVAAEDGMASASFVEGDLFKMPFPDNSFDAACCWGVLHHTGDPLRGLREMCRVVRPGGLVAFYVYNKANHWRHNIQYNKIIRRAGGDLERRFEVAHQLYGTKPIEQMSMTDKVGFYDRYCVPFKTEHSFGEILGWFDTLKVDFHGTSRPARFRDFIRYLQFINQVLPTLPKPVSVGTARTAGRLVKLGSLLPKLSAGSAPFKRPSFMHRLFWEGVLALQGLDPRQSHSTSFSGRVTDATKRVMRAAAH